jgi:hypothetical protein
MRQHKTATDQAFIGSTTALILAIVSAVTWVPKQAFEQ